MLNAGNAGFGSGMRVVGSGILKIMLYFEVHYFTTYISTLEKTLIFTLFEG